MTTPDVPPRVVRLILGAYALAGSAFALAGAVAFICRDQFAQGFASLDTATQTGLVNAAVWILFGPLYGVFLAKGLSRADESPWRRK